MYLGEGGDDNQITHRSPARGRAIDRDDAAAALGADRVSDETFAVVDVPDMDLFVFANIGSVQQVFVDGAGAFVVEFAVGDAGARAAALALAHRVEALMKGSLHTDELVHAKRRGLAQPGRLATLGAMFDILGDRERPYFAHRPVA